MTLQIESEGKKVWNRVEAVACAQEDLLQKVNQQKAEWGHAPCTLPHLPHHLHVQV